jgi:hypothetical protein
MYFYSFGTCVELSLPIADITFWLRTSSCEGLRVRLIQSDAGLSTSGTGLRGV